MAHYSGLEFRNPPAVTEDFDNNSNAKQCTDNAPKTRKVTMEVSAYTASDDECGNARNVTASGQHGVPFLTCASDDLPFGTRVRVHGREYIVMDRFGGGYTNRLDLMMETKSQCFEFGRQYVTVEIIG